MKTKIIPSFSCIFVDFLTALQLLWHFRFLLLLKHGTSRYNNYKLFKVYLVRS